MKSSSQMRIFLPHWRPRPRSLALALPRRLTLTLTHLSVYTHLDLLSTVAEVEGRRRCWRSERAGVENRVRVGVEGGARTEEKRLRMNRIREGTKRMRGNLIILSSNLTPYSPMNIFHFLRGQSVRFWMTAIKVKKSDFDKGVFYNLANSILQTLFRDSETFSYSCIKFAMPCSDLRLYCSMMLNRCSSLSSFDTTGICMIFSICKIAFVNEKISGLVAILVHGSFCECKFCPWHFNYSN